MVKVSVFTQVYNTAQYLKKCIDSVLNQTFSDFEYVLIDNGCTDGCTEIIREYAAKDSRIRTVYYDENHFNMLYLGEMKSDTTGEYVVVLDSDDWWEPDYLEQLLGLAESTGADIVCTGKQMHEEWTGRTPQTKAPCRFVFDRAQFAEYYPAYRPFFMAIWGKIVSNDVVKSMDMARMNYYTRIIGFDNIINIEFLRHAQRVCIDDSLLYHYRLHKDSIFHEYDSSRLKSNRVVYEEWRDFLLSFGSISIASEHHLACQRATFCQLTISNAAMSALSLLEKLREYRRILHDPLNVDLCKWKHPYIRKRLKKALNDLLQSGEELSERQAGKDAEELFGEVMELFAPRCGRAVPLALCPLLRQDEAMADAVLYDDANRLMERSVALVAEHQEPEQLIPVLLHLTESHPTLHGIADLEFVRTYPDIYLALWREDYARAEEAMDALLEEHNIRNQTFLELYLSLAAVNKNFANYIKAEQYREHLRLDDNESFTS